MKEENKINLDFNIPYYIFEELVDYVELKAKGICRPTKWKNIESLIGLAVLNQRLTKEQATLLKENFCRE